MKRKRKKVNNKAYVGTIIKKARRFGFIKPENEDSKYGDFFVSEKNMKGAMVGDKVRFKFSVGRRGDVEARVIEVLQRRPGDFVGLVKKDKNFVYAVSINANSNDAVLIDKASAPNLALDDLVAVKIVDYGSVKLIPYGRVTRIFGHIESMQALSEAIMYDSQIYPDFPDKVEKEVEGIREEITSKHLETREDLRDLFTVTIDGSDAKDFDDAISLEKHETGYRLYVHIADVSHFVREGSELDKEALRRGNSVYVPGIVSPMLPEKLSNDLCSLRPGEDRLCMTCAIDLDCKGNCTAAEVYESVIKSDYRLTYEEVDSWLKQDRQDRGVVPWGDLIINLENLSDTLEDNLIEGGHLDFDMSEYDFELDSNGEPIAVHSKHQGRSAGIIEQCMILANRCVAEKFRSIGLPIIYRVHDKPNLEKKTKLDAFLEARGIASAGKTYLDIIESIKGHPLEDSLMMMVLRSMEKARYDVEPLGHFGLSIIDYCHFTAPIRRYSDLFVHRMIKAYLKNKNIRREIEKSKTKQENIKEICNSCNANEVKALKVERRIESCMVAKLYSKHIGEVFDAKISSITSTSFFIRLDNGVEGKVGNFFEDREDFIITDEYIIHDYETGRDYDLGDDIKVELIDTDILLGWLDFSISV